MKTIAVFRRNVPLDLILDQTHEPTWMSEPKLFLITYLIEQQSTGNTTLSNEKSFPYTPFWLGVNVKGIVQQVVKFSEVLVLFLPKVK